MNLTGIEQRKFKRVPIQSRVGVAIAGRFFYAQAVSISEGGMMVNTAEPVQVGDKVETQVFINGELMSAEAEVLYLIPTQGQDVLIGMKFLRIQSRDIWVIRSFVRNA